MNICVVGTGYVGLVTGSVFSDLGNEVICVDNNAEKIAMLERGEMPIYEPGLEEMVKRNREDHRLFFTTDLTYAVERSDVVFICVGTPPTETGDPDMRAIQEVARGIARALNRYKVIVNKSTVPVGTGDMVREIIETNRVRNVDFDVVSNPEFLREGSAIKDTLEPDRIVIGAPNHVVAMKILELYAPLERPMIITDVASAEMIKYASNAFLATKISFANTIANICDQVGADVAQVVKGMGLDSRIGPAFLNPGLGYGGSCFPKDTAALVRTAEKVGVDFKILRAVMDVNAEQPIRFLDRLRAALDGSFDGKTIGILGLAFKPNTDDMRDAKSVEIIARLLAENAEVKAYDPIAMDNARRIFPQICYGKNAYDVAQDADALVIVTEWNEFKLLDMERIKSSMRRPILFDGRNIYDPIRMRRLGFEYQCVGRTRATIPNHRH
ncbi:UDP-glucose dehydrogenase [Chthonomonas calidirosea]|uniref:UDP-glucose 6-dehydrogenase n=1 Tax=Chthonomonas calidirosea (strain DSM 23976 / ICMP 18418 / T49) TaxID=1303518 RepID=S0EVX9_CHTCT|nr:UDP-glucose/GDP-mannose dehydrogenase family protein [Chthonomonas calidirosea]CCW34552.1 nucleotide sugar dehydrogenase [Chthonomonas calidirosea T49]CEK13225.1 UDP-glucose dehydrogenase [Chthonomonas calidirosea]CEK13226.1 UDP-glucose dehydrogenase [Chthonomonas calidirosea]CEK14458.1 UDP-glucose dehydrogenase [Chthonomonas calidirosea]